MKKSAAPTKPVPREKPAPRHDKYFLRDLHQEFASPGDREVAEKGLRAKRAPLEKTALGLVASGVSTVFPYHESGA